jgi:predicted DNA helicase
VLLLDDEELMAKLRVDASKLARAEPVGVPTAFRRTVDGELVTDSAEVASLLDAAQLNESQRNAVTSALAQRLTLIQGPPGTGKTHCSVQLLKMFVANQRELSAQQGVAGEHTVLATANSNTAADNLLEGLLAEGVKAVRAGPRDKVRPTLQAASMQAKMEHHPARKVEKQLEEIVAQLVANLRSADDIEPAVAAVPTVDRDQPQRGGRMGEMSRAMGLNAATAAMLNKPKSRRELKDKLHRARTQLEELRKQIKEDIYSSTEVVVATCIAAGGLVDTGLFKVVLIDEASQSTVPTCLVPISKGCRQLVLVGDSNQLPPTVKTDRAMQGGLNRSLFERLQDMGISSIMLNTQYRMHPTIAAFSSEHFYRGELRSADNVASLVPPAGFDWPIRGGLSVPVAFVEAVSDSGEDISLDGASRSNYKEAEAVVGALRDLLMAGDVAATDIGIVTPYKGQVELLGKMLATEPMFEGVEVNSVDGYQGREKELVMFSAVRSNPERRVGFLADWRRLNVAITRAKRGLLMFGDPETLRGDEIWANLLDYFAALAVESNGAGPNKLSSGIFESVISPELDQLQRA